MNRSVDYDDIAATYDRRYQQNEYAGIEQAVLQIAGNEPDRRVLEVGCGTGHWLALLRQRGFRVAGLDASSHMLARAQTHVPGTMLARGRAEYLPWVSGSFDRVFCINALHHFRDKQAVLAEARRVLRPGGTLMIVGLDPHRGLDSWCIYEYFPGTLETDKQRYPATQQIRQWMSAAGFVDCRTTEVQHMALRIRAIDALAQSRLDKAVTSQLSALTDAEYAHGISDIRAAIEAAHARGEELYLTGDLHLYATIGSVPP